MLLFVFLLNKFVWYELCTQKAKTNIHFFILVSCRFSHLISRFLSILQRDIWYFRCDYELRHRSYISNQSNARFVSVQTSVCSAECFKYFKIVFLLRANRWQKYVEETKDELKKNRFAYFVCSRCFNTLLHLPTNIVHCKCVLTTHSLRIMQIYSLFSCAFFFSLGLRFSYSRDRAQIYALF